jgi:hypothetical protein
VLIAHALVLTTVVTAEAAPLIFTNEADFNAAVATAGISLGQDGFEGLPTGFIDAPLDRGEYAVTVANINPSVKLFVHSAPTRATDGATVLIAPSFIQPMTFDFDERVRAFSVDVIDTIAFAPAFFTIAADGASPVAAYRLPDAPTIQFLGVLDLDGFQSLSLSTGFARRPTLTSSNITIDRLRYEIASVPEPATLALFGAGLIGLTVRRRRRRH